MRNTQIQDENGDWIDGEPEEGQLYRRPIGEDGWHMQKKHTPPPEPTE